ncbi:MAG: rubredoxin-like domain-containing protein [Sphaerochaeta sp.]
MCEICGFIYGGDNPPSPCPISKVPSFKIHPIQKEAI